MDKNSKIYIAGHRGLVGSAILSNLQNLGYTNILTRTHNELDLIDSTSVKRFFEEEKPEYVILAAAKVGGIVANNTYRADFLYENLMIQNNVIHESYISGVKKLLFLGSTCIYPKNAPQPMREDVLLSSELEYTNEPYAIAKIAGIKLCESYNIQYGTNFISVMPTNLYGPNDNFDLEKSHVLPALIRKIYLAKLLEDNKIDEIKIDFGIDNWDEIQEILTHFQITKDSVEIWGSGKPRREFLWSEDMAEACVFLMQTINFSDLIEEGKQINNTHINIGTGIDVSIFELANCIKDKIGFKGELVFNTSKPDGTLVKLTDVSKLHHLGWKHKINLNEGIDKMITWYMVKNNFNKKNN